jgi:hypothetical protein
MEIMNCPKCNGTGMVLKKAWVGLDPVVAASVHPAIAAGMPAQRTVVEVPCDEPTCSARKKT